MCSLVLSERSDEDYSVLESTVVHGYDPRDEDYGHLEHGSKLQLHKLCML